MKYEGDGECVQFADVQVIRDAGVAWLCLIDGKRVAVQPLLDASLFGGRDLRDAMTRRV